jgi:peptidoglycan-N-acetylglucosamine deacetylase
MATALTDFRRGLAASLARVGLVLTSGLAMSAAAYANGLQPCAMSGQALGVSRIVEIDTSTGALFGSISTQSREARFLEPKEVVLTFDDGPMPAVTRSILDTLDRYCTKATFFSVGRMAVAYPATVRSIVDRGHTLGTHTWSHPLSLRRLPLDKAKEEIEKGYAAVTLAAGRPIAPFFRFPGLSDSGPMLNHLQSRGIAAFTVDVVSNDSYIADSERLLQRTLKELDTNKGGIVLFHDIKPATARMLPRFLAELQSRGYRVVHLRAKGTVEPQAAYTVSVTPLLAKGEKAASGSALMPFYGLVKPGELAQADVPVSEIAPAAKPRPLTTPVAAKSTRVSTVRVPGTAVRGWSGRIENGKPVILAPGETPGWTATVRQDRRAY